MKIEDRTSQKKRILITGGSGFLGGTLVSFLRRTYDVFFTYRNHSLMVPGARGVSIDLNSPESVCDFFDRWAPSAVIHCAAMTDVDACESLREEAYRVNVLTSQNLAKTAAQRNIFSIYISTEAVYGDTRGPHREIDTPQPMSWYASTKLQGEDVYLKANGKCFIARTGFEGWSLRKDSFKISFFEWVIRKLYQQEKFAVFKDRFFTPFSVYNFVDILDEIMQHEIVGVYNVEGSEVSTYLEFAQRIAEIFSLNKSLIVPAEMNQVLKSGKRPHDTTLDVSKVQKILSTKLLGVDEILEQFRDLQRDAFWIKTNEEWARSQKVLNV